MSDCTVEIKFEDDKRVFEAGEKIAGSVHVCVDKACRDTQLKLARRWRTSGRPSPHTGGSDDILLFEGEWDAPGTYEYPFIFHIPPGPYTFHGRLLSVDWFLCAEASGADVESVRAEQPFAVEASGRERRFIIGDPSGADDAGGDDLTGAQRVLWGVGSLLLLIVGLWLLYPSVAATDGASWATLLAGVGCVTLAGLSGRRLLATQRDANGIDDFAPTPADCEVEPGDFISFVVELQPNFKTSPRGVTALLKGYERALFSDGDTRQSEVHRFHEEPVDIEPVDEASLAHGQKSSFRVSFRVPAHAPYSFWCPTAAVIWAIEVHVDVGSWPDWRRDFPLVVRPCVGPVSARPSRQDRSDMG